jgi:hypothetical protein
MDPDTAKLIIAAGSFVGFVFWLIGIAMYRKMAHAETERRFEAELPNRSPSEAIDELIANGQLINAQSHVERPDQTHLTVTQMGVETRFEATRLGSGARLVADVDDSRMTRKFQFWLGVLVLIIIPLIVGGVCVALWNFVAPSPTADVRWQSIQVVQIVHVLWPQFLIYFLWKSFHSRAGNAVSNLLFYAQAAEADRRDRAN